MARKLATADVVTLPELLDFVRPRHRMVLTTFRAGESVQSSPVTGGVDGDGRIVVATYPRRAKSANIRRRPRASMLVLSDEFDGPYVQVDGHAEVIDLPEAVEGLVDYFRSVAGEPGLGGIPQGDDRPAKVPDQGHPAAVGSGGDRWVSAGVAQAQPRGLNRTLDGVCGSQS